MRSQAGNGHADLEHLPASRRTLAVDHEPRYAPHFRPRIHSRGRLPWAVPPTYAEVTVSERKRTPRPTVPNLRQHFLPVVVSVVPQHLTPLVGRVGDAFVEPRLPSAQP